MLVNEFVDKPFDIKILVDWITSMNLWFVQNMKFIITGYAYSNVNNRYIFCKAIVYFSS